MTRDLYSEVTDNLVAQIEAGAGDWRKPWATQAAAGMPVNACTGHEYRGVNVLSLWGAGAAKGYPTAQWASFKQWIAAGAAVRKGEKGTLIVYAGAFTPKGAEGASGAGDASDVGQPTAEQRTRHFLRCSHVFNVAQVQAIEGSGWTAPKAPELPHLASRIDAAEAFVAATRATIRHGGDRAFFAPELDYVGMPERAAFRDTPTSTATENYYSTLLHELTHWTGHASRLAREFGKRFGSDAYAAEELVAELGAAFLCAQLGIAATPRADHAQYLANWLRVLKSDKRAIFTAAARASDASDYLRNLQPVALPIAA